MSKAEKNVPWGGGIVLTFLTCAVGLSGNAKLIPPILILDAICTFTLVCTFSWISKADSGVKKFARTILALFSISGSFWCLGSLIMPGPDISFIVKQVQTALPVRVQPDKPIYIVTVSPKAEAMTGEIPNRQTTNRLWPQDYLAKKCTDFVRRFEIENVGTKAAVNVRMQMNFRLIYPNKNKGIDKDSKVVAATHSLVLPAILSKDRVEVVVVNESHKLWLQANIASVAMVQTPGSDDEREVPVVKPLVGIEDKIMPIFPLIPSSCEWSGISPDE